jgi:hypothetical protein
MDSIYQHSRRFQVMSRRWVAIDELNAAGPVVAKEVAGVDALPDFETAATPSDRSVAAANDLRDAETT